MTTTPHQIVSIDGTLLSALGIEGWIADDSTDPTGEASFEPRTGGAPALFASAIVNDGELVAVFDSPNYTATAALLALLDWPGNPTERAVVANFGNPASLTEVTNDVVVTGVRTFQGAVYARLAVADPIWRTLANGSRSHTTTHFTDDEGMSLTLTGQVRTRLSIRIVPGSARQSGNESDEYGWKYRKTRTITNTTDETIDRFPYRFSLGDTTPLTTAKAMANGDDLRVVLNGDMLPRTLVGWDSADTYVWVIIDGFGPGEERTYEFWYGNPEADTPDVLAYPDLPPFDLANSDNSQWTYLVQETSGNAGKGLWYLDRGTRSPRVVDFDVPGAWQRYRMQDNRDVVNQSATESYVVSSTTYWHGILDVQRQREGAAHLQDEGLADGIIIFCPTGITKLSADFRFQNSSEQQQGTTNEVQTLTITGSPTGGTFKLSFEGEVTASIARNASAGTVQSALEALSSIGSGNVACGGGAFPGTPVTVTFQNALGGIDVPMILLDTNAMTGGSSPTLGIVETTKGQALTAIGQAVIMTRAGGGESWETVWSKSHIHNSSIDIGTQDFSPGTPYPTFMYVGGLARDTEVPQETRKGAAFQLKNRNVFKLYPNTTSVVTDTGLSSEEDGYDLYGDLAFGRGGSTETHRLYLGGKHQSATKGRLFVPLGNGVLVDGERRAVEEWDDDFTAKVGDRNWSAFAVDVRTVDGDEREFVTADWLSIRPRNGGGSNTSFDGNITNWTEISQSSNSTVAWSYSTSFAGLDGPGNALANVSANTEVGTTILSVLENDAVGAITVDANSVVGVSGAVLTTNANLLPRIGVRWYDSGGSVITVSYDSDLDPLPANTTWFVKTASFAAPAGAATARLVCVVTSFASGATGFNRFDALTIEDNVIAFGQFDEDVAITALWRGCYLS